MASPSAPRRLGRDELPVALRDMRLPPERAYLWGVVPPGPYVALVGRRTPTSAGAESARRLARELAKEGVTILSGGAAGIDTAAHQGALDAGGRTLVVAPAWLTRPYPSENEGLFRAIVESGGGYLTFVEESTPPFNPVFFQRNEALVALAQIVVVGECAHRSGAKNAVAHALRLGRPLHVLPSLYGNSKGAGSNALLVRGARPVLSSAELVAFLESQGTYNNPSWWRRGAGEPSRADDAGCAPARGAKSAPKSGRQESNRAKSASGLSREGAPRAKSEPGPPRDGPHRDGQPRDDRPRKGRRRATAGEGKGASAREAVRRALRRGAPTIDEICEITGVSAAVAQHELLLLLLSGEAREDERGLLRYVARPDERG